MPRTASSTSSLAAVRLLAFHQPEDYWYKPPALPQGYWTRHFEIRPCRNRDEARRLLPANLRTTAFLGDSLEEFASWGVGRHQSAAPRPAPRFSARAAKSPYELACLRQASRLGARGHLAAARAFEGGASEFEIELAFIAGCGLREQDLPYNPIIALNESGSVLHYQLLENVAPGRAALRSSSTPARSSPAMPATSPGPTPIATPTSPP